MRALRKLVLLAGLALAVGQAFALPSPPQYSADGLYNLANAYARAGKPGLAVLSYERAALLAPGDADIIANLAYVRAAARVAVKPPSPFARFVELANPLIAAWLGVLGIVLIGIAALIRKLTARGFWSTGAAIVLGSLMIAFTACNALLQWPRLHEAIVLVDQTPARVSPAPMADPAFVLREADSVTIRAAREDFILIRTRGGLTGWVARASLGEVVPTATVER